MSGHTKCICNPKTNFKNTNNMRVVDRKCNYSAFESPKGQRHSSDYSTLVCVGSNGLCPMMYRSKDDRIWSIPDLQKHEIHFLNSNTSQHNKS